MRSSGDGALYTVGHSTRALEEFLALLDAFGIERLVDVRTVPRSRHVPWFNKETLPGVLRARGILYTHLTKLGGLRHARKDSKNGGWRNASFRGYADYMATPGFFEGIAQLNRLREKRRVAIMCAEAVPWRCHRSMIADAEVSRGVPVLHIMSLKTANPHTLTGFAVVDRRSDPPLVQYPPYEEEDAGRNIMPLKKGSSRAVVGGNIKELVDSWKKAGAIGSSRPATKKKAIKQAVAIALAKAGKSRAARPRRS